MSKTLHKHDLETAPGNAPKPVKRKRRWFRTVLYVFLAIVLLMVCARPMLPWAVRWYVNKTLSRSVLYEGRIGDVTLNLWRGAYSIDEIRFIQTTGNVPQPL